MTPLEVFLEARSRKDIVWYKAVPETLAFPRLFFTKIDSHLFYAAYGKLFGVETYALIHNQEFLYTNANAETFFEYIWYGLTNKAHTQFTLMPVGTTLSMKAIEEQILNMGKESRLQYNKMVGMQE